MTDNQTTELLREGLTERGIEWRSGLEGVTFVGDWCFIEYDNGRLAATCEPGLTPEQAIAATLESDEPIYDELLRCLENDWNIKASWDGLRKFWCVELTEEGVRMRDAHDEALRRIAALEELVWFMVPFFGSACSHECGCPDDYYFDPYGCDDGCKALKELNERMKELGIEVD